MSISCDVNCHSVTPLSLQGHFLLAWQRGTDLRIGCRADSRAISGFCCHQQAILNELPHQLLHETVGKIMIAFLITEPVYREILSNIQNNRARYIQVLAFCPAPLQDRLHDFLSFALQPRQVFLHP